MKLKVFIFVYLLAASPSVYAQVFRPLVTKAIGSGPNTSYFSINFDNGIGLSDNPATDYTFAYNWNPIVTPSPTGEDMITALTNPQNGVGLTASQGFYPGFGYYINTFGYHGLTEPLPTDTVDYWSYWTTTGSRLSANKTDWDYSGIGISARILTNNSYDGWVLNSGSPKTAVSPEAGGNVLLISGILGIFTLKLLSTLGRSRRRPH